MGITPGEELGAAAPRRWRAPPCAASVRCRAPWRTASDLGGRRHYADMGRHHACRRALLRLPPSRHLTAIRRAQQTQGREDCGPGSSDEPSIAAPPFSPSLLLGLPSLKGYMLRTGHAAGGGSDTRKRTRQATHRFGTPGGTSQAERTCRGWTRGGDSAHRPPGEGGLNTTHSRHALSRALAFCLDARIPQAIAVLPAGRHLQRWQPALPGGNQDSTGAAQFSPPPRNLPASDSVRAQKPRHTRIPDAGVAPP